jgi:hypothetical protein
MKSNRNRNRAIITATETFAGKEISITDKKGRQILLDDSDSWLTWDDTSTIIKMFYGLNLVVNHPDFYPDFEDDGYQDDDYTGEGETDSLDYTTDLTFEGYEGKCPYTATEITWEGDLDTVLNQVRKTLERIRSSVEILKEAQRKESELMLVVNMD